MEDYKWSQTGVVVPGAVLYWLNEVKKGLSLWEATVTDCL